MATSYTQTYYNVTGAKANALFNEYVIAKAEGKTVKWVQGPTVTYRATSFGSGRSFIAEGSVDFL